MPTPHLIVRPSAPSEFDTVLPVCVEAFADEAVSAWVEPDPVRRQERTQELFGSSLRAAVDAGELLVAFLAGGGPIGASVWTDLRGAPPEPGLPDGVRPASRRLPHRLPDRLVSRLAAVRSATGARHPDLPHVYLSAMAVLPHRRGLGAGSALLRHGVEHARVLGLPVYLEASTPRNQRLYARHGFRDHGEPIPLPDGGPVLQPMWREAP